MTMPCRSIRYSCVPSRDSPIGCRSRTNTSTVDGSTRLSATSATQGDCNSRRRKASRSAVRMLVPLEPGRQGLDLFRGQRACCRARRCAEPAATTRSRRDRTRGTSRRTTRTHRNDDADRAPGDPAFLALAPRRLRARPAKILLGAGLDAHARSPVRTPAPRSAIENAIGDRPDRSGTKRDDEVTRPREPCDRGRQIVDRRHHVHRAPGRAPDGVGERVNRDAGNRRFSGRRRCR